MDSHSVVRECNVTLPAWCIEHEGKAPHLTHIKPQPFPLSLTFLPLSIPPPSSSAVQLHRDVEVGEAVGELRERVRELEKHNTTLKNKVTFNTLLPAT